MAKEEALCYFFFATPPNIAATFTHIHAHKAKPGHTEFCTQQTWSVRTRKDKASRPNVSKLHPNEIQRAYISVRYKLATSVFCIYSNLEGPEEEWRK